MKRNPAAWLRGELFDRVTSTALLAFGGVCYFIGAGMVLWQSYVVGRAVPGWSLLWTLLPGALLVGAALVKARRGLPLADMKKGAEAEEKVGQAIEYALTRDSCAIAHDVEEVAKVGNIDHLVATPHGLWVIETKSGRVPRKDFPEVLRRIARNVEGVREWAPDVDVTGCLVFASEQGRPPQPTYTHRQERIRAFADPDALMRALREEARNAGGDPHIARKLWPLAKVKDT